MIELSDKEQKTLHVSELNQKCLIYSGMKQSCKIFKYSDGGVGITVVDWICPSGVEYCLNKEQTEILKLFLNETL